MKQIIKLPNKVAEQLDAAITQSMSHGDDVIVPLNSTENMVLQFDAITGTITGWIEEPIMEDD